MDFRFAATAVAGMLLTAQIAAADGPEVQRNVGTDGVPVITIKGEASPRPSQARTENTQELQTRKAFRVYEMQGDPSPQPETKVVVVSPPPPIAPNDGCGWGYGYGYPIDPYYGGGFYPTGGYSGFYPVGGYGLPVGSYLNYQTPPLNYQNPPVNYQNPPANYRPIYRAGGYYPGRRCR